jgi:hypothetical protein
MSKQIILDGWVSVIPNKMFNNWVKKKWIPKEAVYISSGKKICSKDILAKQVSDGSAYMATQWKLSDSISETRRLIAQGFKKQRKQYYVTEKAYTKIRKEIGKWYDDVFSYVGEWLKTNGYMDLQKGSFDGGFCAVTKEDETTKKWGAPLAGPKNKIAQIKEKFGEIVVYFTSLSDKEEKQIKQFSKEVENKFDCITRFI